MKALFTGVILSIASLFSYAQNDFEGTAVFDIEYTQIPEELQGFESMLPSEMMMSYKGAFVRVDQSMGMGGSQAVIYNSEDSTTLLLMDMMGMKIAVNITADEAAQADTLPEAQVTYLDGTKKISGYKCKRVLLTDPTTGTETTVWYSDKVGIEKHNQFDMIDGYPVRYEVIDGDTRSVLTLREVKEEEISDQLFAIPSDYEVMTMEEMENMGK